MRIEAHMARRATRAALVVGTVLTAINQGTALLAGPMSAGLALRIAFTYTVPFLVSLYAMVGTVLEARPGQASRRAATYLCRTCQGSHTCIVAVAAGERLPSCPQCGSEARWVSRLS